jgi:ABC-type Fe3+ transport system substrate-binding protein
MPRQGRFACFTCLAGAILLSLLTEPAFAFDQALVAAAKKEGQVTWYTTQIIDQFARPAAEAFEKEFGIKVNYVRADSNAVALRILNEGRAGRVQADVFDGTAAVAALKKENLVLKWEPDAVAHWPANLHDSEGYWAATNLYVLTPGYNTDLVPKGTEPKTWNDLLAPKWKGKMVWSSNPTSSGGPGFIGLVLAQLGQEQGMDYLRKLSAQKVTGVSFAARQVLDQVIAGEYSVALQIFDNHPVISAAQGAPCDWVPMNPAMGVFSVISVTKGAPHVAAGKLLVDFLTSREGQNLYRAANYIPVDPEVPPKVPALRPDGVKFKAVYFTPEQIDSDMPKWASTYNQLFR